jgi:hypothetical protein
MPPLGLATLIGAVHIRPFQMLPMLLTPALIFSSYVNLAGYKIDSAGMTAAWSGIYVLLALRRRNPMRKKFTARGGVRGAAIALGAANCLAGGVTYMNGNRDKEKAERIARNRWGDRT